MSDPDLTGADTNIGAGSLLGQHTPHADDPLKNKRTPLSRIIDAEKVVAVALNPDDEIRNLQVALLYSLTSRRLDELLFPPQDREVNEPTNANWFTLAQWAVLTVGRNMRTRDVPNRVGMLPSSLRKRVTPAVLSLRASDDRRIAAALSFGQVMVLVSTYNALLKTPGLRPAFLDPLDVPIDADTDVNRNPDLTPAGIVDQMAADHPAGPGAPAPAAPAPAAPEGDAVAAGLDQGEPAMGLSHATEVRLSAMLAREAMTWNASLADARKEDNLRRGRVVLLARQLGAQIPETEAERETLTAGATDVESPLPLLPELMTAGRPGFYDDVLRYLAKVADFERDLLQAFGLYNDARLRQAEITAAKKEGRKPAEGRSPADLVFEANLRLGAIEQIILDEAVTMVINHVPEHLAQQAEGRLAVFAERSLRVPRRIAQVNASKRIGKAADLGRDLWARVMTDQILVLALPSETIRLGRDLPCRDWTKPFYAAALADLSPTAQQLFDSLDRSLGDGRGAGAGDWRRWDDRLNFVANLMRSRHDDPSLFWQAFTDEDEDLIWRNRYPSRVVDPFEQAVRSPWFPEELGHDPQGINHLCGPSGK